MPIRPLFITFEGIDFSGKSTQCALTRRWLDRHHHPHLFVREPGGTAISERIRNLLLDRKHGEMSAVAELFLFSAARSQLVRERIVPALADGTSVIADRFFDSTSAYQGYGRKIDLDAIKSIHRLATGGLNPDLTFLIDIDVEESMRRRAILGRDGDRMESADTSFFERVRQGYIELSTANPARFTIIDGCRETDAVFADIARLLHERYST